MNLQASLTGAVFPDGIKMEIEMIFDVERGMRERLDECQGGAFHGFHSGGS